MGSLNKVTLIGRLGQDPEQVNTRVGTLTKFSLATSESWQGQDGQRHEETVWHSIVVGNKQADACFQYLAKGRQVYVEGKIKLNQWEDRDGNKQSKQYIKAYQVIFLSSEEGRQSGARRNQQGRQTQQAERFFQEHSTGGDGGYKGDEVIPF